MANSPQACSNPSQPLHCIMWEVGLPAWPITTDVALPFLIFRRHEGNQCSICILHQIKAGLTGKQRTSDGDKVHKWYHKRWEQGAQVVSQAMGTMCASGTTSDGDNVRKWYHKRWGQGAQVVP